jgi:PAS domain S-box-containing protein
VIESARDITDIMKMKSALQESEARFRLMFQRHNAVMLLIDPESGMIVDANQAAEKFYGYSRTALCARGIQDINILPPDEIAAERQRAITEKRNHFIFPHQLAIGDIRTVEVFSSPIEVEQKKLLFSIINDVTRRIQLEAHLRQEQKLESIGTLASGVAHEINNPIMGVMNYAQLISQRLEPEQEQLREYAGEIKHETERVAEIARNLLAFARHENQAHSLTRMTDIMNSTLTLIRTVIKRDQITLNVDIPDDLPQIKCRAQQIQQVLMNLLTNARDALNQRYPKYDANKIATVTVHPFEEEGQRWLRITVEDHGVGIPAEIRERIFDPFYTSKDRALSTGLGLSISLGIVQDHNGKLTFESEEGQPTRFYLDLPVDSDWKL